MTSLERWEGRGKRGFFQEGRGRGTGTDSSCYWFSAVRIKTALLSLWCRRGPHCQTESAQYDSKSAILSSINTLRLDQSTYLLYGRFHLHFLEQCLRLPQIFFSFEAIELHMLAF